MFTVRRQLAHHKTDEFDVIGDRLETGVFEAFSQFPWSSECDRAQEFQNLSPSLYVLRPDGKEFVASIVDKDPLNFYLFVGETQRYKLFGIFERERRVFVQGLDRNESEAREALEAFLANDEAVLRRLVPEGWV